MLEKKEYTQFGETIYSEELDNGLKVKLLPKKSFHKVYGIMSTNYGSADNEFVPYGKKDMKVYPAGIAHFLEHKLFEKKDYDAFELFGKYGADSNAFTSFTRTSYLFSATQNVEKCVEILLDFVQEPYFSEESVKKEQGIIGQEIKMYDDDSGWQLYFGLIENLYPNTPISQDIAGTIESISKITAQDLYDCYNTFYQPSNMTLFLVGNFDETAMISLIKKNQAKKTFSKTERIVRAPFSKGDEDKIIISSRTRKMDLQLPKVAIGIKGLGKQLRGYEAIGYKLKVQLLLDILFGESSKEYLQWYNENIIDDSFGYDFQFERGFNFAMISGSTSKPEEFKKKIEDLIVQAPDLLEDRAEEFELSKKEFLGSIIRSMNSLESIANRYEGRLYDDATIFDMVEILEKISLEDVVETAEEFLNQDAISIYELLPESR